MSWFFMKPVFYQSNDRSILEENLTILIQFCDRLSAETKINRNEQTVNLKYSSGEKKHWKSFFFFFFFFFLED